MRTTNIINKKKSRKSVLEKVQLLKCYGFIDIAASLKLNHPYQQNVLIAKNNHYYRCIYREGENVHLY